MILKRIFVYGLVLFIEIFSQTRQKARLRFLLLLSIHTFRFNGLSHRLFDIKLNVKQVIIQLPVNQLILSHFIRFWKFWVEI